MALERAATAEEASLAADFAARRPDALARAYARYAAILAATARHVLVEAGAAEDCVHDALLRVWNAPDSYRAERGALHAFLVACVRNEALSALRGGKRRGERELRAMRLDAAPVGDEDFADPIDAARVRNALARLPEEQRRAIEFAYYENLTQTEIAARLGVPLGTVKGRIALAMRKLRAELGGAP